MPVQKAVSLSPSDQVSDPYDFYVPPPPKEGGIAVAGRVDRAEKARISMVIQGGQTPFRTESDYVRAAVTWFGEQIIAPRMDKRFQDDVKLTTVLVHAAQQKARIQGASKFVHDVTDTLLVLSGEEAWENATTLWNEVMAHLERSPEPFRTNARRKLEENPKLGAVKRRAEAEARATAA